MTALPSVEPIPPGTRPIEPGWYVAQDPDGAFTTVHVFGGPECARTFFIGHFGNEAFPPEDDGDFTFIARIYPDRIGQE